MEFSFTVRGKIQAKERPRKGRYGFYTPKKTKLSEAIIQGEFRANRGRKMVGALQVRINLVLKPCTSTSKRDREAMLLGKIHPTKKPDIDNSLKTILDALNGFAYNDDSQVVELFIKKRYGSYDATHITIKELT